MQRRPHIRAVVGNKEGLKGGLAGISTVGLQKVPACIYLDVAGAEPAILWRWVDAATGTGPREREDNPSILRRFLELAAPSASDAEILRFSTRFGPLLLCQHEEPVSHWRPLARRRERPSNAAFARRKRFSEPRRELGEMTGMLSDAFSERPAYDECVITGYEPTRVWRTWARHIRSIVELAWDLRGGVSGHIEYWKVFGERRPSGNSFAPPRLDRSFPGQDERSSLARYYSEKPLDEQWTVIIDQVQVLLEVGGVRPFISTGTLGRGEFVLEGNGCFGAIVRDLAQELLGLPSFQICHFCKVPFEAGRRRRAGQRHCCGDTECVKAQSAATSQDARNRRKQP